MCGDKPPFEPMIYPLVPNPLDFAKSEFDAEAWLGPAPEAEKG